MAASSHHQRSMQRSSRARGPAARPGQQGGAEKDQPPKSILGFSQTDNLIDNSSLLGVSTFLCHGAGFVELIILSLCRRRSDQRRQQKAWYRDSILWQKEH